MLQVKRQNYLTRQNRILQKPQLCFPKLGIRGGGNSDLSGLQDTLLSWLNLNNRRAFIE